MSSAWCLLPSPLESRAHSGGMNAISTRSSPLEGQFTWCLAPFGPEQRAGHQPWPGQGTTPICAQLHGDKGMGNSHPQRGALPHLVCGPGRNNPAPSTLINQWVGLKRQGTVVPALSSLSNCWALGWALPAAPGHQGRCSSTHRSQGGERGLNQQAGSQGRDGFQPLLPPRGSGILIVKAGRTESSQASSYRLHGWPQSIVCGKETFPSCTNWADQLRKLSFRSTTFSLVLSKPSHPY